MPSNGGKPEPGTRNSTLAPDSQTFFAFPLSRRALEAELTVVGVPPACRGLAHVKRLERPIPHVLLSPMYAVGDLLSGEPGPDLRLRELVEPTFPDRHGCGAQESEQRKSPGQTRRIRTARTAGFSRRVVTYLAVRAANNLSALLQRMASMKVST